MSIIVPAHNEARNIQGTLQDLTRAFSSQPANAQDQYEIIVVDDGSTDGTAEQVQGFHRAAPMVRVVRHEERRGKGYSLRCGVAVAQGKVVAFLDADGDIPASVSQALVQMLDEHPEFDLVIGSKRLPGSRRLGPFAVWRAVARLMGNLLIRWLLVPGVRDTQCGVKAFRGPTLKSLVTDTVMDRWSFDIELLALAHRRGLQIHEEPVIWRETTSGRLHLHDYLQTLGDLVRIWWRLAHLTNRAAS